MTDHFHNKVLNYLNTKSHNVILDLFTYNLQGHELNTILTRLNEMKNGTFRQDETSTDYIQHFKSNSFNVDPKNLLDDAFKDKLDLKILNIYKGLVVNTASKIVKITDEYIYISFESLQGVILDYEKKTVLQSDNFSQDISADVKQINLSKKSYFRKL